MPGQDNIMQELIYKQMQYNFATPTNYDPAKKYPLIIYIHGAGGRGHDLKNVGYPYMLEKYIHQNGIEALVAAPLCEYDNWFMCFSELIEFVRFAASMDCVDTDRVYLMGGSMGGYTTWNLLMCVPELIAAAVPICGGGMSWNAGRIRLVPLRVFHGVDDPVVPVTESINMANAVRAAGGRVELHLLPDCGHNAWEPALYDYHSVEWLLSHRLSDRA